MALHQCEMMLQIKNKRNRKIEKEKVKTTPRKESSFDIDFSMENIDGIENGTS